MCVFVIHPPWLPQQARKPNLKSFDGKDGDVVADHKVAPVGVELQNKQLVSNLPSMGGWAAVTRVIARKRQK